MDLNFDLRNEYDDGCRGCHFDLFVKTIKGNNEKCSLCFVVNNLYDKYTLTCKHTYHTKCFRRYCFLRDAIICPMCNYDIKPFNDKMIESNKHSSNVFRMLNSDFKEDVINEYIRNHIKKMITLNEQYYNHS